MQAILHPLMRLLLDLPLDLVAASWSDVWTRCAPRAESRCGGNTLRSAGLPLSGAPWLGDGRGLTERELPYYMCMYILVRFLKN